MLEVMIGTAVVPVTDVEPLNEPTLVCDTHCPGAADTKVPTSIEPFITDTTVGAAGVEWLLSAITEPETNIATIATKVTFFILYLTVILKEPCFAGVKHLLLGKFSLGQYSLAQLQH
tara:strand:- start:63 stop:413 length:351 start_codon:yes stop_codon:yes gene_type:complete